MSVDSRYPIIPTYEERLASEIKATIALSNEEPGQVEKHCEMCGDTGVVQVERIEYVTHDMAIDAGAPEMEGQPQSWGFENVPCPRCFPEQTWTAEELP